MKKLVLLLMCSFQLMGTNIDWSFPPVAISAVGHTADTPQIGIDSNGNAVAIWVESGLVKSKYKLANMNWNAIEKILSGMGGSSPSIVCDGNGNATAVWQENGVVKSASKTLNGNWSSSVSLSASNAASPSLAVDSEGDVIVAWARNGDVQTTTKLFGGNWQNTVTINATSSAIPRIAIGGTGSNTRASVVWQAVASSVNVVYGASKLISVSSWGNKQILSDTAHSASGARTVVDASGNVTAVWFAYDVSGINYSRVLVQSTCRPADGEWMNFATLSEPGIGNPTNLSLKVAYDVSGNAIALWNTTFDNETFSIQSAIKPAYKGWSQPINLVSNNLYAYNSHLVVSSLGDALALYMFSNGLNLQIQSSELDITGFIDASWALPLTLSDAAANSRPFIAASVNGNVINTAAVWLGSTGLTNSVLASVGTKTIVAPPSNLSVIQSSNNFGVVTEYYNTLSWDPSTDPNVVGYLIYRNGVFIEQVGPDVMEIVDNNRVQNGSVVYGVAAADNQQSHSRIITISFP